MAGARALLAVTMMFRKNERFTLHQILVYHIPALVGASMANQPHRAYHIYRCVVAKIYDGLMAPFNRST
jgi:hypothetical protein